MPTEKKINKKKEHKYILSAESAKEQMDLFLDRYDFDTDIVVESVNENIESIIKRLTKAIRRGYLSITEDGEDLKITQNLQKPPGDVPVLNYGNLTGKSKMALKKVQANDGYGRLYTLVGKLTGVGYDSILSLEGIDLSIVECLGGLFLSV